MAIYYSDLERNGYVESSEDNNSNGTPHIKVTIGYIDLSNKYEPFMTSEKIFYNMEDFERATPTLKVLIDILDGDGDAICNKEMLMVELSEITILSNIIDYITNDKDFHIVKLKYVEVNHIDENGAAMLIDI